MKRKIIQIMTSSTHIPNAGECAPDFFAYALALTDSGDVYRIVLGDDSVSYLKENLDSSDWIKLPDLPQDEAEK